METGMWREFVEFAEKKEESFSAICARFGVSRKTGYKWLNRFRTSGPAGLVEQSRRPRTSPRKTPEVIEDLVRGLRRDNPDWSAIRICEELKGQGVTPLPAPSTIDLILRRRREIASLQATALGANPDAVRFEPNYRWAIRLGRELKITGASAVQPLIVRDETTDFIVGVFLLPVIRQEEALTGFLKMLFQRHGLPWRLALPFERGHTTQTVWLMRLGVSVDFVPGSDPAGPAGTQGLAANLARLPSYQRSSLEERVLKPDLLEPLYRLRGLARADAIALLEQSREQHNFGGKQEALQKRTPIFFYRPSARVLPEVLPALAYAPEANVRLVSEKGIFTYQRRLIHVGRALAGLEVELRPILSADHYLVLFAGQVLGQVSLLGAEVDETTSLSLQAV